MRKTCLACVLKHLGQAAVLMMEARLNYPSHKWLAVGHLAEASEECVDDYPELASEIREFRLIYLNDESIPIMYLIEKADKLLKEMLDASTGDQSIRPRSNGIEPGSG